MIGRIAPEMVREYGRLSPPGPIRLLAGDLHAMLGSTKIGAERLAALARDLGNQHAVRLFPDLLGYAERVRGTAVRVIVTFGRVPMIFYIAHIFLLHTLAVFVAGVWFGDARWLFHGLPIISKPETYGFSLTAVYAVWIAAVAALYPLCRWFSELKQRRSDRWLSYL